MHFCSVLFSHEDKLHALHEMIKLQSIKETVVKLEDSKDATQCSDALEKWPNAFKRNVVRETSKIAVDMMDGLPPPITDNKLENVLFFF